VKEKKDAGTVRPTYLIQRGDSLAHLAQAEFVIRHGSTKRVAAAVGEGSTAALLVGSLVRTQTSNA
jgi:hypothetical protein